MKMSIALVLALALAASPVLAAEGPLQGSWKFLVAGTDGKEDAPENVAKLLFIVDGDKYKLTEDGKEIETGTLKLGKDAAVDTIDWTIESGDDKGKVQHGIFKVTGNVSEYAYFAAGKDGHPKDLANKEGQSYTKCEKTTAAAASPASAAPAPSPSAK